MPLVRDAIRRWANLERTSGKTLLRTAGALMMGPAEGRNFAGNPLHSVIGPDADYLLLSAGEVVERFPWLQPDSGTVTIYEPGAATLSLEACLEATLEAAEGADLHFNEPAIGWSTAASGVRVRTERGEYPARRLAIAAGAWTPQLLPELSLPIEVERTVQYWFEPAGKHALALPDGPAWVWELEQEGTWYGFPPTERGLKAGMHFQAGRRTDVEQVDREVGTTETEELRKLFGRYAPGVVDALTHASVCLYTNTPDEDFILDRHPDHPGVVLFAGGSGHAFKFAPVLGSLATDLLTDVPPSQELSHFSIDRFR